MANLQREMRTYYQVYRDGYWHTSTTDKAEAIGIAVKLCNLGHAADVRVEGRSILGPNGMGGNRESTFKL